MQDIILHGDTYACLNELEDNSVAVAITSPPYWKQRDYEFELQIGQEKTPEEYIGKLIVIFHKLKEKLRDDGIFFLNIGDKYFQRYGNSYLLQIPYRLAYHMIKDGWLLEDIIIWYKPNHMPSSIKNRFVNSYEPIIVFAKNKYNIYNSLEKIIRIPLQQTSYKHPALFPESLIEEILKRANLKDGDIIVDPFAGTGTVASVVKKHSKNLFSIMIEGKDEFIDIIKERTNIKLVNKVEYINYNWKSIKEKSPFDVEYNNINIINTNKYGEIFIADETNQFISALRGITTQDFKSFHREDALYFFGVKNWTIEDLYYIYFILQKGYVLRNMLVISDKEKWYPVFMFVRDSRKVEYRFYIDRIRVTPKTNENKKWHNEYFIGLKVKDTTIKKSREGIVSKVIEKYKDGFPKIVIVQWDNGCISKEIVLHPGEDEILMESLLFICPKCENKLEEPYDPVGKNICYYCGTELWTNVDNLPIIEEPSEFIEIMSSYKTYEIDKEINIEKIEKQKKITKSKFIELNRINWGASPGARKLMHGDYFTKMRLYRIDQPIIAQYLTILAKHKGLNIKDIINALPKSYYHTVGHWFRKDFGGSTPIPEDIKFLRRIFGENRILDILERSVLKFQTVKNSIKGKAPEDFIDEFDNTELSYYLEKLYIPSEQYIQQPI